MNNNNEEWMNEDDEEEPINNNNPPGDQEDDANNDDAANNANNNVFNLTLQYIIANHPNAVITGPLVQALAAPGHYNTVKYVFLTDRSNLIHTAESIYGDANRRRRRTEGAVRLIDLRRDWVKQFIIEGGYIFFTAESQAAGAL